MVNMEKRSEGILYRNPLPHIYSRHAYFPSVVALSGGELVAAFSIGQAFEAEDVHSCIARSVDNGETWSFEGRLYPGTTDRITSDVCRLSPGKDGAIVAFMIRHDRSRTGHGLANPQNLGFVEVELLLFRSTDGGFHWEGPEPIAPPLIGPSFEMTSSIVPLRDGRWLLPTSTWRGWDGYCPNGMKMVAFQSFDNGRTWPAYADVMADPGQDIIYWESKMIELADGRLLAAAWAYDERQNCDLPNQFTLSTEAGGLLFANPRSTGLIGQTLNMAQLDDGRILTVYRRMDNPGLWANISRIDRTDWVNEQQFCLWDGQFAGSFKSNRNMADTFAELKFGAPHLCRLADGSWLVTFWAVEAGISAIRYVKLTIS